MARTNYVNKARKAQGLCMVCRDPNNPINIGDPYKWVKPRYHRKVVAHPNCTIPLSMTSSSKTVAIIEEITHIDRSDLSGVVDSLRSLADTVRQVAEEYQESCDNQREYFPDSEVAEQNE